MTSEEHIKNKYIGTLIGCLAGDCLGVHFEFSSNSKFIPMVHHIASKQNFDGFTRYSDDTALTRATCENIIEKREFSPKLLAEKLVAAFFENPHRGYAGGAQKLFVRMQNQKERNYEDFKINPYMESIALFDGSGSMGNGSGMRVSPIALLTKRLSIDTMTVAGALAISLTHSNEISVVAGLQQCFAVRLALENDVRLVSVSFYDEFFDKMIEYVEDFIKNGLAGIHKRVNKREVTKLCENYEHYMEILLKKPFKTLNSEYLDIMRNTRMFYKRIKNGEIMSLKDFHTMACNCGVKAHESIPVALFAFLVASNEMCQKEVDNKLNLKNSFQLLKPIERVILYAISLGGDTDTIGSMAGAIAGAFYGFYKYETLSRNVFKSCESCEKMSDLGSTFYSLLNDINNNPIPENDKCCCPI